MQKPTLLGRLRAIDAYPKINEDFFTKTFSGGVITIIAGITMTLLFLSELRLYLSPSSTHELSVDTSRGEQIVINVDVTFPKLPCSWLSLDAMDVSGEMHLDVDHDIYKQRLSKSGQPFDQVERHDVHATKAPPPDRNQTTSCGSCYGADDEEVKCCNTCDELRQQYRKRGWALSNINTVEQCVGDVYLASLREQEGEGCHMWGTLLVNKVAGNFHFAPGRSYQQGSFHIHDLAPFEGKELDFSHRINSISFGQAFPGQKNPLDGVESKKAASEGSTAMGIYQYFLKVVPTIYTDLQNKTISSNQYSVTEHFRETPAVAQGRTLPGLFFFYDLSPIKIRITDQRRSFLHFLTNLCAIIGGVFTVSGIVDAFVFHGENLLRKKMDMGKQI